MSKLLQTGALIMYDLFFYTLSKKKKSNTCLKLYSNIICTIFLFIEMCIACSQRN